MDVDRQRGIPGYEEVRSMKKVIALVTMLVMLLGAAAVGRADVVQFQGKPVIGIA